MTTLVLVTPNLAFDVNVALRVKAPDSSFNPQPQA
jgi:hypothetical protein